jgi:hypothetical protein
MNQLMLLQLIKQILASEGSLKAKEILQKLPPSVKDITSKSDLNALLYKHEQKFFLVSDDFTWRLIETARRHTNKAQKDVFSIEGTVTSIGQPREGVHKGRKWKKQDVLLKSSNGGHLLCFSVWNNSVPEVAEIVNAKVKVHFLVRTKVKGSTITAYLRAMDILVLQESK